MKTAGWPTSLFGRARVDGLMLSLATTKARPWWVRIQVGLATAYMGAALRYVMAQQLADRAAYVTFFPAVIIAALLGGAVAGFAAMLLSAFVVLVAMAPAYDRMDFVGLELFLGSSLLIIAVSEVLHRIYTRMIMAEESLRSEGRLQAIIDGAGDAIVMFDEHGAMRSVSAAALRVFGYAGVELLGESLGELFQEPYRTRFENRVSEPLKLENGAIAGVGRDIEGRRKDGAVFPIELAVIEVHYDDQRRYVGFIRDLSERLATEQRLDRLRAERLNAMGGMAAAMAHELNQPLAATALYLRSAQRLLAMEPDRRPVRVEDALESASTQVIRAGRIISHIRAFVSRGEPEKRFHALHQIIEEVTAITRPMALDEGVRFELDLAAPSDLVLADEVQIKQVLVNLIKNAIEALSGREQRNLCVSTREYGVDMICVSVADSGPGLSQEIEARLFEPFTTSKAGGMGVGLSVCRSIIEEHHGRLWAERPEEGGAVFCFSLPLAPNESELET